MPIWKKKIGIPSKTKSRGHARLYIYYYRGIRGHRTSAGLIIVTFTRDVVYIYTL